MGISKDEFFSVLHSAGFNCSYSLNDASLIHNGIYFLVRPSRTNKDGKITQACFWKRFFVPIKSREDFAAKVDLLKTAAENDDFVVIDFREYDCPIGTHRKGRAQIQLSTKGGTSFEHKVAMLLNGVGLFNNYLTLKRPNKHLGECIINVK